MQIYDRAKRIVAAGVLTGLLILGGCGPSSNTGKPPGGGTPEVAVVTIQPTQVAITTELTGRTSAYLVAEVRPQVGDHPEATVYGRCRCQGRPGTLPY